MITVTVATHDDRFVTLYLKSDWKVSKLREMIANQLNLAISNTKLLLDGESITNNDYTLEEANIKDGDVIYALYVPDTISLDTRRSNEALEATSEAILQQKAASMLETFPPGSMDLEGLRISSPELHAAITSGESERVVDVLRNLERIEREQLRERQMRLLQAQFDPLHPDSQRLIQESIASSRINENLANAQAYLPESFGNIFMLYIDVDINRVRMQALVDTGAQTTVMSKECAQKCNLLNMVDTRYKGLAVGVSTSKIIGKIHLANMKIGNTYIPFSVVILDSIQIDFILGLDLLRRHQCIINLVNNTLQICGENVQFLAERDIPKLPRLGELGISGSEQSDNFGQSTSCSSNGNHNSIHRRIMT